ncbi:PREDICTED: beta-lactoglobulin-like [Elephantulus edwardii]|uniref:beta-lactoglobulin-like n=1 Tax=Elephantulus edwardii TaxID=28737 RepID=UPI0003F0EBDC|nr:PREDICTED: beta-lactoglobulin-like [Elephantulus edwardii]
MALGMRPVLLLTLGLGLISTRKTLEEVPVQQGFDAQRVQGRWLTLQLASTSSSLVSPDDPLRLALHSIRMTASGALQLILFWMGEGVCQDLNITVHPTGLYGQYQGFFEAGGSVLVQVVGTNYHSLILYVQVEQDAETNSLWALLGRTEKVEPQWLGEYLDYVRTFHLKKAPVFNLDGGCPPLEAQASA